MLTLALLTSLYAIWPSPRSFGPSPPYRIERTHGFVAGGMGLVTSRSLTNAWMLREWNITGGLEIPTRGSWTLVPRGHLSGASGTNTGAIHLARVAVDGRIAARGGSYREAGIGIGLLDSPISVTDASFNSREEQVWSGTPFLQLVAGLRGNPEQRAAFMAELTVIIGAGVERPGALEVAAGVEF